MPYYSTEYSDSTRHIPSVNAAMSAQAGVGLLVNPNIAECSDGVLEYWTRTRVQLF